MPTLPMRSLITQTVTSPKKRTSKAKTKKVIKFLPKQIVSKSAILETIKERHYVVL